MIAGGFFVLLGVIGLILPVIPQIPFFVLGIVLLMTGSERFKSWIENNHLYVKYLKTPIDNFYEKLKIRAKKKREKLEKKLNEKREKIKKKQAEFEEKHRKKQEKFRCKEEEIKQRLKELKEHKDE